MMWVASLAGIFVCTGFFSWLLAQAKSHAAAPDDRRLLEPLAELAAKKRTPREISGCV